MTALTATTVDRPEAPRQPTEGREPTGAGWTINALFTPASRFLALAIMVVSFVFPVGGLSVDLCVFHSTTGLPCPGCGMSRGISAISQGDFSAAAGLNPFAFIAWPLFFCLALLTFIGRERRERLMQRLNTPRAGRIYMLAFTAFLAFGLIRLAVFAILGERFP